MDDLNYIIAKAKEQIAILEDRQGLDNNTVILQFLKVIRDAVYTKSQIGEAGELKTG